MGGGVSGLAAGLVYVVSGLYGGNGAGLLLSGAPVGSTGSAGLYGGKAAGLLDGLSGLRG